MKAKSEVKPKTAKKPSPGGDAIGKYAKGLSPGFRAMCAKLRKEIDAALPKAISKIWHGSPVWFLDEIPVVGYNATAKTVNLLFWNGRAHGEPDMKPVGKFNAAQFLYTSVADIDEKVVRRSLKNKKALMWDPKSLRMKS